MLVEKIRIAIIGTGNIGTDLCARILKNPAFEVVAFVGRRDDRPGLIMFKDEIKHTISTGIDGLLKITAEFDGFLMTRQQIKWRRGFFLLSMDNSR